MKYSKQVIDLCIDILKKGACNGLVIDCTKKNCPIYNQCSHNPLLPKQNAEQIIKEIISDETQ